MFLEFAGLDLFCVAVLELHGHIVVEQAAARVNDFAPGALRHVAAENFAATEIVLGDDLIALSQSAMLDSASAAMPLTSSRTTAVGPPGWCAREAGRTQCGDQRARDASAR